jgi:hypothetical protein
MASLAPSNPLVKLIYSFDGSHKCLPTVRQATLTNCYISKNPPVFQKNRGILIALNYLLSDSGIVSFCILAAFGFVVFFGADVRIFLACFGVTVFLSVFFGLRSTIFPPVAEYFFWNFSTLPAVSKSFCLPVKNGWHAEQISAFMTGLVERVTKVFPHAQVTSHKM